MQSPTGPLRFLKRGFHSLFPTCRDVTQLQSELLDRELSFPQRLGLRLHLLACGWCRRYRKQIRFLHQALHEHPDEFIESNAQGLSPEARERLKDALRKQAE